MSQGCTNIFDFLACCKKKSIRINLLWHHCRHEAALANFIEEEAENMRICEQLSEDKFKGLIVHGCPSIAYFN